ncbi:hypothetical protein AVEN_9664-1 [Araneus ventricosus]|uniref:DDE-1 domain-containing protein n=1 Tax=Araneus ventricosus TaxID=182803 RepID=A0A4Y2S0Y8_ARAVE|nr:hypothetical protein AVEN_219671-1 [Araneus ventricosus]GBN73142.1 hypothetical protein AVEN_200497-1 [Araneus ventricosus]GBN81782.1 hypothetical protein AVEN_181982-1 [Araneus ventricosus]GBN81808.1 hypothetical protein AVEN_9664-1 [Araneus ventricosus]
MVNDANPNPALIQPMDQNVIENIKLGYRKLLLKTILNDPLRNENLEKTQTNVNLKDVVFSLANWTSVSTLLINKSWKNLLPDFIESVNSIKISHSEARAALNTSLHWAEEQNFEAHGNYDPQTFKRPRI